MDNPLQVRKALTIAGSDSGGGAGIQADLKTFMDFGVHGSSVITAVTAQNTLGVVASYSLPGEFVVQQLQAVLDDIGTDAAKTGMLPNSEVISAVASTLKAYAIERLVVDPVLVSTSGHRLMEEEAVSLLKKTLFPLAMVVTPNIPEAEALTGISIKDGSDMREACRLIHRMGPGYILVKGGHLPGDAVDVLYDGEGFRELASPRVIERPIHGTGCTLSAAITAGLALGMPPADAVAAAKEYISRAIAKAQRVGKGLEIPGA